MYFNSLKFILTIIALCKVFKAEDVPNIDILIYDGVFLAQNVTGSLLKFSNIEPDTTIEYRFFAKLIYFDDSDSVDDLIEKFSDTYNNKWV